MNLNQVSISCKDIERSINFYESIGLLLIVKSLPDYARFECPDGDATFSIHRSSAQFNSNTLIYFECDDVDRKVHELISKNIEFEEMPKDQLWKWREARLFDPDGNTIILYFAGQNRKYPPWRIV